MLLLSACVTLAPGPEKVLFTENPADVAGYKVFRRVVDNRKPTTSAAGRKGLRNARGVCSWRGRRDRTVLAFNTNGMR